MRLVTGKEMRQLDAASINEYGIPSVVLMENAGVAVVRQAQLMLGTLTDKKVAVFVGSGNNGGDGLVVARHLYNKGVNVRVFLLAQPEKLKGDVLLNYQILQKMGVEIKKIDSEKQFSLLRVAVFNADLLIDAILGTGLVGEVTSLRRQVIELINDIARPVLACDIPSGLSAEKGCPLGVAVHADCTVTFAFAKLGLVLADADSYVGELVVADISLPLGVDERLLERRELLDESFCRLWLKPRAKDSNKGDFGRLLLLAGSPQMPGASILAAKGALGMGVGLLTAAVPQAVRFAFTAQVPEAMLLACAENSEGLVQKSEAAHLAEKCSDALLVGPGLGRDENTMELVREVLAKASCPILLDADGLYAFGSDLRSLAAIEQPLVITPHPGEMARLLNTDIQKVQQDRLRAATFAASESNAVVVLKGACTVIATPDNRVFVNSSGNPGMATGGSGDVLSGMISALLAQKMPPVLAATVAVYLHGLAGDIAAQNKNQMSISAGDIAVAIAMAYNTIIDNR